jgi:peptidyl-prolyl cis-trans isomerase D
MLRGIQKATANWLGRVVMGVILGLIAISFAIWGVGDIFRGFGQSTVAKVGSTEIRVEQFRQTYLDRLQQLSRRVGRPITPDQARAFGLDRQLLAQTIAETVLDERARTLGLALSDAELARRVTEDETFRGMSGSFDRMRFDQIIRQAGLTEGRFLAEQRKTAIRQQLIGTVSGDTIVPKAAVDAYHNYQNEQRTVEYVKLDPAQAGDIPAPDAEALNTYFEERKITFRAPEYRKVSLLVLTPGELAAGLEISDADVQKAYNERKTRYVTPERRHILQLVFPDMVLAKAGAEKIAQGMTFAALATERGFKDSDIELGTLTKAEMIDRVAADAAFALKEGETSQPVEGRFGAVLLHVVKVEPEVVRPLAEIAPELKQELATERARTELSSAHDKIEDERLAGASLTDIAQKLNLKVRTIDAIDRSGRMPDGTLVSGLPQNVDVLSSVFTAEIGPDSEPLSMQGSSGYVWYEVMDIKPARERPLEEVKDQVTARWRDDEIAKRLKAKTDAMLEKLKGGASFNEVAAAENLKAEWLPGLKRGQSSPSIPALALQDIFRAQKDGVGSTEGGSPAERIVYRVTEIKVADFNAESEDAKRIDEALRRALSEDVVAQYLARLEKEIGVTINQTALNQVVGGSTN